MQMLRGRQVFLARDNELSGPESEYCRLQEQKLYTCYRIVEFRLIIVVDRFNVKFDAVKRL